MFEPFQNQFNETLHIENITVEMKGIPFKYSELLLACGGKTYDNGLYTIHTFDESVRWTQILKSYFPFLGYDFISFGHDWLGRQFCVPVGVGEHILVFDPTTQQEGHIETNLLDFHNHFLLDNKEAFFLVDYWEQILDYIGAEEVPRNKCLGFKLSMFVGGEEEITNYDLFDLEVYWDFEHQIFQQVSVLPPDTKVKVVINPFAKM